MLGARASRLHRARSARKFLRKIEAGYCSRFALSADEDVRAAYKNAIHHR